MIYQFLVGVHITVLLALYYGLMTGLYLSPLFIFLGRIWVTEEDSEMKMTVISGFITGNLMTFISIFIYDTLYYEPLYLALIRHHTITVLILRSLLRYLFFNFVHKNNKHYYSDYGYKLDSGYKNPNSISKFSIFKAFLNNLLFHLVNPLVFPSSILLRLMNINLFRSNHKLLFLTSTFGGWFFGHIFISRSFDLIAGINVILLFWLQRTNSIKSKFTLQFEKYLLLQIRNYAGELFIVISFVIFARYSGFDQYVILVYGGL